MNQYITNYDRKKTITILLLVSVLIAYLFNWVVFEMILKQPMQVFQMNFNDLYFLMDNLGFIKMSVSYGIVYAFLWNKHNKSMWKKQKKYFKSGIPDISGEWVGTYISNRKNENEENIIRKMNMKIIQDFTEMSIECTFYDDSGTKINSKSFSQLIGLYYDKSGINLKFTFFNNSREIGTTDRDYPGYNEFRIDSGIKTMFGKYYTGRENSQHSGNMELNKQ